MTQTVQRLSAFLSMNKESEAGSVISILASDPAVKYVALLDERRGTVTNSGRLISGKSPAAMVSNETNENFFVNSLVLSRPLYESGVRVGWLYAEASMKDAYLGTLMYAGISALVLGAVALVGVIVSRKRIEKVLNPMGQMSETLEKVVGTGNYGFRVPRCPGAGEQGKIVDRMNTVLRTVEAQTVELHEKRSELANAKRLESIGLLASGVANDLNNILGPLLAFPDMVAKRLPKDDEEGRELLSVMRESAAGAAQSAHDLLAMANRKAVSLEPIELKPLVLKCLQGQGFQCILENSPTIRLETRLEEGLWVDGSAPHLRRAILNLLTNAVEAMEKDGGRLFVDASSQVYDEDDNIPAGLTPGEYVHLRIRDTGVGIERKELGRIVEPFFTTKAEGGSSSGLGLSVVDGIAHEHGAVLNFASRKGRGTRVELFFPTSKKLEEEGESVLEKPEELPSLRGNERVLIVDDFEVQRRLTERILSQHGYSTKCVPSGREAVEVIAREEFDILVLDMIMEDGFDGLDTFLEVQKTAPEIKCVIMTGLTESERVDEVLRLGASDCLSKPYTMDDLARAVRKALDEPPKKVDEGAVILG